MLVCRHQHQEVLPLPISPLLLFCLTQGLVSRIRKVFEAVIPGQNSSMDPTAAEFVPVSACRLTAAPSLVWGAVSVGQGRSVRRHSCTKG